MRINVLGGGPAGLYVAMLLKRDHPVHTITVFEQNPRDVTWGFGVVFSDRALSFLKEDDPETHSAIAANLVTWDDITIDLNGAKVAIDGVGFAAIARLQLLQILALRAEAVGVDLRFGCGPEEYKNDPSPDLLIVADGVNSSIRSDHSAVFGTTVEHLNNRFAWYGTTKTFPTLTQTFRKTPKGGFNAHHYQYAPGMSTFIVETTADTWKNAGLDRKSDEESRRFCENVFRDSLNGHPLISNKSIWRTFPKIWNENWYSGNIALIGDALHTAHFSIGSGTRLALEDAICLARSIREFTVNQHVDLPTALQAYQDARKPIVEKLVSAANDSATWYERFEAHMALHPLDFAHTYITRAGRLDDSKLAALAPRFMRTYAIHKNRAVGQ